MNVNQPWKKSKLSINSWKKLWTAITLAWVLLWVTSKWVQSQNLQNLDSTQHQKDMFIPYTNKVTTSNTIYMDNGDNWNKEYDLLDITTPPDTIVPPPDTIPNTSNVSTTSWFNAFEASITHQWNARLRDYANFWLDFKLWKKQRLQLWYSGMNEFTQNLEWYFGRHVPNIWISGIPKFKAIGVVKTTADGILDAKYGLRYIVSDQAWVDYWRVDVAWNSTWASATFFLGKNIGNKWTNVEVLTDLQFNGKDKKVLAPFTEFQVNQTIAKWFNVFTRWEVIWANYKGGTYLLWVSKLF